VLQDHKLNELGEYDKKVIFYLQSCIKDLRLQINALTFVLNEDTGVIDIFIYQNKKWFGLTYQEVFETK